MRLCFYHKIRQTKKGCFFIISGFQTRQKRAVFYLSMSTIMVHVPCKMLLLKRVKMEENPIKASDIGEIVENGDHFVHNINFAH